jgi:PAS domain S-box-containing protein
VEPRSAAPENVPFAGIVAGIADAVIYADRNGTIRAWNEGATEIFGFSADEAVGQSLDLIIPERLREAHWRGYRAAIERAGTTGGRRARLTRGTHREPDRPLYVEMSFAIVRGQDGSATGAVAVARDVTQRHLDERAKRKREFTGDS